jgi:hypothetical protein
MNRMSNQQTTQHHFDEGNKTVALEAYVKLVGTSGSQNALNLVPFSSKT